ncbi:hypothetical protein PEBR_02204 [Penicillium brasilianum]|uniref:Uncharacterized protein n=1 Tax=Penicillium brasilianum TaxID=104259 RepID=A0A1S9S1G2_PENBI|nr:hypothetical protein PEBR_02204 [Penicillium brasilianum]
MNTKRKVDNGTGVSDSVAESNGQDNLSDDYLSPEMQLEESDEGNQSPMPDHKQRKPERRRARTHSASQPQTVLNTSGRDWHLARARSHEIKRSRRTPSHESDVINGDVTETPEKPEKSDNTLRLRLDLDLDIEIELKAKIQGDITLSLL